MTATPWCSPPGIPGSSGSSARCASAALACTVLPAVSSVATAFARAGLPWDDAVVVSAHGRDPRPALNVCRAHPKVAVLTGPGCGPAEIGAALAGWDRRLIVGEHLGSAAERVTECSPAGAAERAWDDPNVVLVLAGTEAGPGRGGAAGDGEWGGWYSRAGLGVAATGRAWRLGAGEDEFDSRDAVLTKAEVRALALARLGPGPRPAGVGRGRGQRLGRGRVRPVRRGGDRGGARRRALRADPGQRRPPRRGRAGRAGRGTRGARRAAGPGRGLRRRWRGRGDRGGGGPAPGPDRGDARRGGAGRPGARRPRPRPVTRPTVPWCRRPGSPRCPVACTGWPPPTRCSCSGRRRSPRNRRRRGSRPSRAPRLPPRSAAVIGLIAVTVAGRASAARLAEAWPGETRAYDGPTRQALHRGLGGVRRAGVLPGRGRDHPAGRPAAGQQVGRPGRGLRGRSRAGTRWRSSAGTRPAPTRCAPGSPRRSAPRRSSPRRPTPPGCPGWTLWAGPPRARSPGSAAPCWTASRSASRRTPPGRCRALPVAIGARRACAGSW